MITQQFDEQIPLILRIFENALRSGYSIGQGLEILSQDLPDPAKRDVQTVLTEIKNGTALLDALDHWLTRRPSEDLNLVVATVRVQLDVGGNLADKFQLLAQIMNQRSPLRAS